MSNPSSGTQNDADGDPLRPEQGDRPDTDASVGNEAAFQADYRLAQRCAAGEVDAWEEIYAQCHDRLVASIRVLLAERSGDADLVDEIAARVWYALVENDGELLLRYDPARGARLITFMRVLAKDLMRRHFRSELRRRRRERVASSNQPQHHDAETDRADGMLEEFVASLSPTDREFCFDCMLGDSRTTKSGKVYSNVNFWQKTRRLYKRMLRVFGQDS